MINRKNVLAIIPARGGSKGIPLKNLRKLRGLSLIAIVANVVHKIKEIDRVIVSTDSSKIAAEAEKCGLSVPFRRPKHLSGDRVSDFQVLINSLKKIEKIDKKKYELIIMLQPTSPLRKVKNVKDALNLIVEGNFDSVWTVSETDLKYHPLKQLIINKNKLEYYDKEGINIIARQQLKKTYHRNGVAYVVTRKCILNQNSIKGKRAGALVIRGTNISIDTEEDIKLAEKFIKKRNLH